MKTARPSAQRGISFFGLLIVGVILALLAIVGARVVPTVSEYMSILKVARNAAQQGDSVPAVREAFDRGALVDYITSIKGTDLDITKEGDRIVVSFYYEKEIPLAGPAYLLLKYKGSTNRR